MAGNIELTGYKAKFELDNSGLTAGLAKVDLALKKSLDNMGKGFKDVGKNLESAGKSLAKLSVPIAGLGALAIKIGSDFQAGMSEVQAISGATAEDMVKLTEKAKEMGATTKFSAKEAADALKYMSMAGWDTNQMLGALEGVMDLAAASGEDLALVSDIVTDALTGFGMQAHEAGKFADLLASASSNSNTNVGLMGETFKYVAPLFGALKYSAEDAALATGLMANAGIKGGQAGTALRSALTKLINPTDESAKLMKQLKINLTDAKGEMLPFADVMVMLRKSFANLTEEQQAQAASVLFWQQAMSGMLAIINASEEDFQKLTKATKDYNGTAKEMAEIMEDNLQGQITKLKSALEGLAIKGFEIMLPTLEQFVDLLQQSVDWLDSLDSQTQKNIVTAGALVAAASPLLIIGGKVATGIGKIIGLFGELAGGATIAGTATATAGASITTTGLAAKASAILLSPWVGGLALAVSTGFALHDQFIGETIPTIDLFGETVSDSTKLAVGGFLDLEREATLALNQLSWGGQEISEEMKEKLTNTFADMKEQIVDKLNEQKNEALESLSELFIGAKTIAEDEKAELLKITQEKYDNQIKKTEDGNMIIKAVLDKASRENRALTEDEKNQINKIKEDMKQDAIRILSESEKEQLAILERLKAESGTISARQAADVVKNSIEQKNKTIAEAEKEYDERLKFAATLRADGSKEGSMLADKVIAEAKRQKDDSIKNAEEMHDNVVKEAKAQSKEFVDEVNWSTGKVKTQWENLGRDVGNSLRIVGDGIVNIVDNIKKWNKTKPKTHVFKTIWNQITGKTPSYDVGTKYVPSDQLALLHKGEAVLRADQNPWNPANANKTTKSTQKAVKIDIGNLITINGNVDKDNIDDVDKIANKAVDRLGEMFDKAIRKSGATIPITAGRY